VREYEAASVEVPEAHYFLGNLYFMRFDDYNAEKHYKNETCSLDFLSVPGISAVAVVGNGSA
jgi:hypothetical protein